MNLVAIQAQMLFKSLQCLDLTLMMHGCPDGYEERNPFP